MTDKQIIIDGVNVAGCEHFWNIGDAEGLKICKINFDNNYFSNGISCGERCSKHPNCYYKQLKRKEQELQEAMDNYVQLDLQRVKEYNELVELYKAKEQECDKLYIQLKADEEYHKEEENTLRKIIKNKEERNIELYKENNKLKQTLTEIKEIVGIGLVDGLQPEEYSGFLKTLQAQILQKISECKAKYEYNTKDKRHINENNQEYIAEGNRMTKIEYDIKSDMIAQEEKKKIKRSECPYGGIDCAWCGEDCE